MNTDSAENESRNQAEGNRCKLSPLLIERDGNPSQPASAQHPKLSLIAIPLPERLKAELEDRRRSWHLRT